MTLLYKVKLTNLSAEKKPGLKNFVSIKKLGPKPTDGFYDMIRAKTRPWFAF